MAAFWAVFTFGGSGPALTAHGSLNLKQEIQIQILAKNLSHHHGFIVIIFFIIIFIIIMIHDNYALAKDISIFSSSMIFTLGNIYMPKCFF
jgi:hypothetical protein